MIPEEYIRGDEERLQNAALNWIFRYPSHALQTNEGDNALYNVGKSLVVFSTHLPLSFSVRRHAWFGRLHKIPAPRQDPSRRHPPLFHQIEQMKIFLIFNLHKSHPRQQKPFTLGQYIDRF